MIPNNLCAQGRGCDVSPIFISSWGLIISTKEFSQEQNPQDIEWRVGIINSIRNLILHCLPIVGGKADSNHPNINGRRHAVGCLHHRLLTLESPNQQTPIVVNNACDGVVYHKRDPMGDKGMTDVGTFLTAISFGQNQNRTSLASSWLLLFAILK
jgi:hypothetical protein